MMGSKERSFAPLIQISVEFEAIVERCQAAGLVWGEGAKQNLLAACTPAPNPACPSKA